MWVLERPVRSEIEVVNQLTVFFGSPRLPSVLLRVTNFPKPQATALTICSAMQGVGVGDGAGPREAVAFAVTFAYLPAFTTHARQTLQQTSVAEREEPPVIAKHDVI